MDDKPKKPRGGNMGGGGASRQRKAHTRNLALAVREFFDPLAIARFYAAVLAGKNPVLVEIEDEETGETRHEVQFPSGGIVPTLEQKMRAAEAISNRGWGQPAQMIQLEAELRGQIDHTAAGLKLGSLPAAAVFALRDVLNQRRALPAASVIDAHAVEHALPAANTGGQGAPAATSDATTVIDVKEHAPASSSSISSPPAV